jgi:hypothetical protein
LNTKSNKNGEQVKQIVRKEQDTNKITADPLPRTPGSSLRSTVSRYHTLSRAAISTATGRL